LIGLAAASKTTDEKRLDKEPDEKQIPVDDVPAFGVQLRFAWRTINEWLAQRRHTNGTKAA
jgi:hypothetical protein